MLSQTALGTNLTRKNSKISIFNASCNLTEKIQNLITIYQFQGSVGFGRVGLDWVS